MICMCWERLTRKCEASSLLGHRARTLIIIGAQRRSRLGIPGRDFGKCSRRRVGLTREMLNWDLPQRCWIGSCPPCHWLNNGQDNAYGNSGVANNQLALDKRLSFISEDKRGTSFVELVKKEGTTLGLILSGGVDKGTRPKISNLRPGSIAHRSDALAVGDYIISVNGIRTNKLKHEEIVNLLKNAGDKVTLEVEYEIPISSAEGSLCVCPKVIQIKLEKENGSFGFTLRGGACSDRLKSRPLTITHVRSGGPADRDGAIKAGDRLLAIDGVNLSIATLQEALMVLKQVDRGALLTIEYDVSVIDAVKNASGALLVEIDKTPGSQLGITLTRIPMPEPTVVIESIRQASIAERCGALHVGDHILAIDDVKLDQMTSAEAMQLLKTAVGETVKLEILPVSQLALRRVPETNVKRGASGPHCAGPHSNNSCYNTLSSVGGLSVGSSVQYPALTPPLSRKGKWSKINGYKQQPNRIMTCPSNTSLLSTVTSPLASSGHVCHMETNEVTLPSDHRGFGFTLQGSTFASDMLTTPPFISSIEPGSTAEKSGVLQVGDRVLAVNGQSTEGLTADDVTQMVAHSHPRVFLTVEFDVAESVIPSSGTFMVKLAKRGAGLGITVTAPKNRQQGDPLIISDIRKGSVAHRTGTIQPGDRLLAIDSIRTDNCTVEDAAEILYSSEDIVKLRIRKDDIFSEDPDASSAVVYTVELARHGGPLGITVSGTEDPFDPIIISGLTEGGLAERTGALHVGDRILAIGGNSLRGKPLSEAILMLQNSGDIVTLKISKCPEQEKSEEKKEMPEKFLHHMPENCMNTYMTPLPSVDSAVESWDSCALEASVSGIKNDPKQGSFPSKNNISSTLMKYEPSASRIRPEQLWDQEGWELKSIHSSNSYAASQSVPSDEEKEDWSKVLEDLQTCGQSQLLRQIERTILGSDGTETPTQPGGNCSSSLSNFDNNSKCPSDALSDESLQELNSQIEQLGNELIIRESHEKQRNIAVPYETQHIRSQSCHEQSSTFQPQSSYPVPLPIEVHKVTLFKDQVYEDFGFSVSDGLYENGVYINRIRAGGPADLSGLVKPFDRILQVNNTKTHNYDCCLTVPLIASSGDRIELVISRPAYGNMSSSESTLGRNSGYHPWVDDADREGCMSPVPPPSESQTLTKTL